MKHKNSFINIEVPRHSVNEMTLKGWEIASEVVTKKTFKLNKKEVKDNGKS